MRISIHADCLLNVSKLGEVVRDPPIWPAVSLKDILRRHTDPFEHYDKYVLALNLARSLLRLYGAHIPQKNWSSETLFFLYESENQRICEMYNPYIAFSLCNSETPQDVVLGGKQKFTILILFAKLLWELWFWEDLEPAIKPRLDVKLLGRMKEDKKVQKRLLKWYHQAIKECLTAQRRKGSEEDEAEQCKDFLVKIVRHLEKGWRDDFPGDRRIEQLDDPEEFEMPGSLLGGIYTHASLEASDGDGSPTLNLHLPLLPQSASQPTPSVGTTLPQTALLLDDADDMKDPQDRYFTTCSCFVASYHVDFS